MYLRENQVQLYENHARAFIFSHCVHLMRIFVLSMRARKRKQVGFGRLEQKLSSEKLRLLEKTIPSDASRVESYHSMDAVLEYFDKYLKSKLIMLGVYPETQAEKILNYYEQQKRKNLLL